MLCPEGTLWVDVEAFEEAAATARRSGEPAAFRAAIDLYAGELLPEDRYEGWAEERRGQLKGLYLSLLTELAALHEERGEYAAAVESLRRVVAEEQTEEGAHVGLMRLYALSGRRREALGQYERLRVVLSRTFGTEPGAEATRLRQEIRTGAFLHRPIGLCWFSAVEAPSAAAGVRRLENLPLAHTSFVGRGRERLEVKRLLAMTSLLTLTGAGGCGKTRLALEVARDLVGAYPDGVWLVELAPLSEAGAGAAGGGRGSGGAGASREPLADTLADALRDRQLLLILDNCEHLVEAVARLVRPAARLMPAPADPGDQPRNLGRAREIVSWPVPPLSMPDPNSTLSSPRSRGAGGPTSRRVCSSSGPGGEIPPSLLSQQNATR